MPDPISVLGAAAAAVQFSDVAARAILQTIKLLKNLKETPKRMKQQLDDVTNSIDRILVLRNTILTPGSTPYSHLTSQQVKRIGEVVSDADVAMKNLHQTLQLLSPPHASNRASTMKSFWRAIVSVSKEKDIEEKIQRINRLHQALLQELQVTGLELHTSLWNLNSRVLSTVDTGVRDVQTSLSSSKIAGDFLQDTMSHTKDKVALIKSDTAAINASVDDLQTRLVSLSHSATNIKDTTNLTYENLAGLRLDFDTFQKYFSTKLDSRLLQEREHTRAQIQSLQNALLKTMTADTAELSDHELITAAHLSQNNKRVLGSQIQRHLLSSPRTLRKATDGLRKNFNHGHQTILQCHCRPSHNLVTVRRGAFKFEHEQYTQHNPQCPFYRSSIGFKSFSLAVQLLPFFNKTVVFTLGATFGAGACAIAPPLKFYATTQRAKSPLFSAFDEFITVCGCPEDDDYYYYFQRFQWDMQRVGPFLDRLIRELSRSFQDGTANGSDVDENGHTMFHEILFLIFALQPWFSRFSIQIRELFRLAILSSADRFACIDTNRDFGRENSFRTPEMNTPPLTVMEILIASMIFDLDREGTKLSIYNMIKEFELEDTISWDKVFEEKSYYQKRSRYLDESFSSRTEHPLQIIKKCPELTETFGYGRLLKAILRRSISDLQDAIRDPSCKEQLKSKKCRFHPLKLAIGWADGIKTLVDERCFSIEAIELAIRTVDLQSLQILLCDWCEHPLEWWPEESLETWYKSKFEMSYAYRMILERASDCGSSEICNCVAFYITKGIAKLNNPHTMSIGMDEKTHPTSGDKHGMCCDTITTEMCTWEIPKINEPCILSQLEGISVYHFCSRGEGGIILLDALYESGHTEVNLKNESGETPLEFWLKRIRDNSQYSEASSMLQIVAWFLRHGASAEFCKGDYEPWPNLHFYLPLRLSYLYRNSDWPKMLPAIGFVANPLEPDGCECHCSSSGCLPFRQTLTCKMGYDFNYSHQMHWCHYHCKYRTRLTFGNLKNWARTSYVNDREMARMCTDACRVEVFDRLGMTHTCCNIAVEFELSPQILAYGTDEIRRTEVPEDDRKELQCEDEELREQLDLIMKAYTQMHEIYQKSSPDSNDFSDDSWEEFWEDWWKSLDVILPDLLPEARCRAGPLDILHEYDDEKREQRKKEVCEERSRREEEALRKSGYLGLDFINVICDHFKDYLPPRDSGGT